VRADDVGEFLAPAAAPAKNSLPTAMAVRAPGAGTRKTRSRARLLVGLAVAAVLMVSGVGLAAIRLVASAGRIVDLTTRRETPDGPPEEASYLRKTATLPPEGIVFSDMGEDDSNASLYVMDVDGTNVRRLTDSPRESGTCDTQPSCSADGRKVVFFDQNHGLMVLEGSGLRQLIARPEDRAGGDDIEGMPTWSRDGLKVIYVRSVPHAQDPRTPGIDSTAESLIWAVNADGTGNGPFGPIYDFPAEDPSWSPADSIGAASGSHDPNDRSPSLSPDGKTLLIGTGRDPSNQFGLCLIAVGSGSIDYFDYSDEYPSLAMDGSWSPDGRRIAFCATPAAGVPWQVYVMNADGSGKTQLTNDTASRCFRPCWSPDGSQIVFHKETDGLDKDPFMICVVNSEGGGEKTLLGTRTEPSPCFIGQPR
jgi:Tol biopolymer transport system component